MKNGTISLIGIVVVAVVSISIAVGIFAFPNAVGVVYDKFKLLPWLEHPKI